MPLSKPRTLYGIHSMTPYNIITGNPYGTFRVLGNASLNVTGELVTLTGGSAPYPWSSQPGASAAEIVMSPKEVPDFLFQLFLGAVPTTVENAAGSVDEFANKQGTSVNDATTGIASIGVIAVTGEANLKFGKYTVVAVSATTIDIYGLTNVDFFRGDDLQYIDDSLKLNDAPITVPGTGGTVDFSDLGIVLTGGSGAVAMTVGDTAEFELNPPSLKKTEVLVGQNGACIQEFGALISSQKQTDGSMWLIDCFRITALGYPFGMAEKAFNEGEITANLVYDSDQDGIFRARHIIPATGCGN